MPVASTAPATHACDDGDGDGDDDGDAADDDVDAVQGGTDSVVSGSKVELLSQSALPPHCPHLRCRANPRQCVLAPSKLCLHSLPWFRNL